MDGVTALIVLVLAVLTRLLPHLLHTAAWGVNALGGGLLFFGSRLGRRSRWQAAVAVLLIALSDWYLSTVVYGFAFHPSGYAITWAWYAAVVVGASAWLYRRGSAARVVSAAVTLPLGFFLLSNGMVWLRGNMYPHTAAGLVACLDAGIPFYRNDALATLAVCGILFGLPALARRIAEAAGHESANA